MPKRYKNIYEYLKDNPILINQDDIRKSIFLPDGFYLEKNQEGWSGWGPLHTLLTYSEPTKELAIRHTLIRIYFIMTSVWEED